jgi:glyoxalase family protein
MQSGGKSMSLVSGYHHMTMSTDGAQEDFDFFTKDLGLHSVKRTVLFDGVLPVYHLYYGSKNGDASTIFTTFPFRKPGVFGRRGTNQSKII